MVEEVIRYSDADLAEFKELISKKIEKHFFKINFPQKIS